MSQDKPSFTENLRLRVRAEMVWLNAFLERWALRILIVGTHLLIVVVACYTIIWWIARGFSYDRVEDIPNREAGLVLGCVRVAHGHENKFFTERVKAAAELFKAGRVRYLIVSGDNHHEGYDEPTDLKAALIARGVPAEKIYCDYAGFRTLDSILRARHVFKQDDFTIISQKFHNERALYIARRYGMFDALAFNAADTSQEWMLKMYGREIFARVRAVLDVEILGTQPKFLGSKIVIDEKHPAVDANPLPVK